MTHDELNDLIHRRERTACLLAAAAGRQFPGRNDRATADTIVKAGLVLAPSAV